MLVSENDADSLVAHGENWYKQAGFWSGVGQTGKGLYHTVKAPLSTGKNIIQDLMESYQEYSESMSNLGSYHPGDFLKGVKGVLLEPIEFFGKSLFELIKGLVI